MVEVEQLVATYGGEVVEKVLQHRAKPHLATYIGPGKLEWLAQVVEAEKIDIVLFEDIVKASQLFRVEKPSGRWRLRLKFGTKWIWF